MWTLLAASAAGFVLGMRHATDADHVVAVTTIVSREGSIRQAAKTGALWGIGHALTLFLAGGTMALSGFVVPARLGLSLEFSVALMLIALGLLNLKVARNGGLPRCDDCLRLTAENAGALLWSRSGAVDRAGSSVLRPLFIGIVHGLSGSAGVVLLLLPMTREPIWAAFYLLAFGAGTLAGMMLVTAALAMPLARLAHGSAPVRQRLGVASGLLSAGFGLFLAYHVGIVDGLFTR